MKKFLLYTVLFTFLPARAAALSLEIPVDCVVGNTCFIQNYVDTDFTEGAQDYRCGHLAYDEHKGTDFRLRNYVKMREGVAVLAAADGTVRGVRNDMPDIHLGEAGPEQIKERECGNGVAITHDDGWETQYCHLRQSSVTVKPGQEVKTGDIIGMIGLSGQTEFPHMHFAVRKEDVALDPFTGKPVGGICGASEIDQPLWSPEALAKLTYQPTALLGMGFADVQPEGREVREGKHSKQAISRDAKVLVVWVDMMGVQAGDLIKLEIIGPDGISMHSYQKNFIDPKAQQFLYTGKTNAVVGTWPEGVYKGSAILLRDYEQVFSEEVDVLVR